MALDLSTINEIFIACGYTDMRKYDGLAAIVKVQFRLDRFERNLYLFCGRRRDQMKALLWDGYGFLMLYKRLDNGNFNWPRTQEERSPTAFPAAVPLASEGLSEYRSEMYNIPPIP